MLTINNAQMKTLARENNRISDGMRGYLSGKGFSQKFLDALTREEYMTRVDKINIAKDPVIKSLEAIGCAYNPNIDAISYNAVYYFFGKIPEEFAPGKTVGDLVNLLDEDDPIRGLWATYLSQYWVTEANFYKVVDLGYTPVVDERYSNDLHLAYEFLRFNTTVEEWRQLKYELNNDLRFINNLISDPRRRYAYLEGLVDDPEDSTSRTDEVLKAQEYLKKMDEDQLTLAYLSQKVDMVLYKVNPSIYRKPVELDWWKPTTFLNQTIYTLDEMRELIGGVVDMEFTNSKGETKKMGGWTRCLFFQGFADQGLIDSNIVKYIANVNDYVYNGFIDARCDWGK